MVRRRCIFALGLLAASACGRTALERGPGDASARDALPPEDVDAGFVDVGLPDGGPASCAQPDQTILLSGDRANVDLSELLPGLASRQRVRVRVPSGARIDSEAPGAPAFTTGDVPLGVDVCLIVEGQIVGRGGTGGSGGTGAAGVSRPCGRDGEPGGTAVEFTTGGIIRVAADGLMAGGGGGGGGASGCGSNAGGGGGAGRPPGEGGAGGSGLEREPEEAFCRSFGGELAGAPGEPGTLEDGGSGGRSGGGRDEAAGGRGGGLGFPGAPGRACRGQPGGDGGRGGLANSLGSRPVQIDGVGQIRGAVDF